RRTAVCPATKHWPLGNELPLNSVPHGRDGTAEQAWHPLCTTAGDLSRVPSHRCSNRRGLGAPDVCLSGATSPTALPLNSETNTQDDHPDCSCAFRTQYLVVLPGFGGPG